MATSDTFLEDLQADLLSVLQATPSLADANILADDQGDIESRAKRALATATQTGGKRGLAVIVLLPETTDAEQNLPGPPLGVKVEIQTLEHVVSNRDAVKGTGIRSSQAAMRVLGALHHHELGGGKLLYADTAPIVPVRVQRGHVSHSVVLMVRASGLQTDGKVSAVTPQMVDGELALTTATAGASIYYTTDGTYPASSNTAATLYTEPIANPTAGDSYRTAAEKSGMNPSDCTEFRVAAAAGGETWETITTNWEDIDTNWENLN